MNSNKNLGIYMDHASAHMVRFSNDDSEIGDISSAFTHEKKLSTLEKSEYVMHNKEQHLQDEYYKNIGETIKLYTHVLLFGPTQAKNELFNLLREDHLYADIKIDVRQTDKLTENQQNAFVNDFFKKHASS